MADMRRTWSEALFPALRRLANDPTARLMVLGVLIGAAGGLAAGALDRAHVGAGRTQPESHGELGGREYAQQLD